MPDSFQNPIGGNPKDPYEKYRIEEIQREKETQDDSEKGTYSSASRHSLLVAFFLSLFRKILDLFDETTERGLSESDESDVKEHLICLKEALEELKTQDLSQDAPYLNKLSDHWHQLLEDALRFRRKTALAEQMRSLIRSIQRYPQGQEHSLGYYLSEYAGQKWLPFPYMDLIAHITSQHRKNPEESPLALWCDSLGRMILALSPHEQDSRK